jgi:hypothetical protein
MDYFNLKKLCKGTQNFAFKEITLSKDIFICVFSLPLQAKILLFSSSNESLFGEGKIKQRNKKMFLDFVRAKSRKKKLKQRFILDAFVVGKFCR